MAHLLFPRELIDRFLQFAPKFVQIPHLEALPNYRFFSLLETTSSSPDRGPNLLTPSMFPTDQAIFWSEAFTLYINSR